MDLFLFLDEKRFFPLRVPAVPRVRTHVRVYMYILILYNIYIYNTLVPLDYRVKNRIK